MTFIYSEHVLLDKTAQTRYTVQKVKEGTFNASRVHSEPVFRGSMLTFIYLVFFFFGPLAKFAYDARRILQQHSHWKIYPFARYLLCLQVHRQAKLQLG